MAEALLVVGAVIVRDGAVLACRRSADRSAGGKWEFPGGKVQTGESNEAALRRELREELGVDARIGDLVCAAEVPVGSRTIDLRCYWAVADEVPVTSTDHDDLRWVRPAALAALDWAEPDWPTVRVLESHDGDGAQEGQLWNRRG